MNTIMNTQGRVFEIRVAGNCLVKSIFGLRLISRLIEIVTKYLFQSETQLLHPDHYG